MWGMCRIDAVCVMLLIWEQYTHGPYVKHLCVKKCEIDALMKAQAHDLMVFMRHRPISITSLICQTHRRNMDSYNREHTLRELDMK
jgi:hypothetical protein